MPKLSMNMSEGIVIEWFVEDGEHVEADREIVEIESEKSTAVLEAPASGTISIATDAGEREEVGTSLATIDSEEDGGAGGADRGPREPSRSLTDTESAVEPSPSTADEDAATVRAPPSARRVAREREVSIESVAAERDLSRVGVEDVKSYADEKESVPAHDETPDARCRSDQPKERVRASPAARDKARDQNVDLRTLKGSGPGGAIVVDDVEASTRQSQTPSTARQITESAERSSARPPVRDRQELSGVRTVIAERLGRSWREAPHVTVDRDVSVERMREVKDVLADELDASVSLNDLFLVAISKTLEEHPDFNATLEEGELVRYDRTDIAIAVDTDRGLVSPVLRGVGEKSFKQLVETRAELVEAILDGDVPPDRLEGGTFTVTNLGTFGVSSFTPIINPPQVAILGLSSTRQEPVPADDGGVAFEDTITASLSFDHRAVDGADAARFLQTFDELLSRPLALVVS